MKEARHRVAAGIVAAVTLVMTALSTLTAVYGMEAGLLALVFAVVVTAVGALTWLVVQITGLSGAARSAPAAEPDRKKRSTA